MNALDLDMADWWQARGKNYLSHVKQGADFGGCLRGRFPWHIAQTLVGFRKAELVAAAEKRLDGLRWLPESLMATA